MGLSDIVVANVSLSNASGPTVANLNTGLLAGYHNHYPDRVRVYSTSTMLAQMLTDGFSVKDPLYKAATIYAGAPQAPALCCVGRRALPPFQTLTLTCVDGAVGDAYALTLVGSDGNSHALAYTNIANLGAPVTGTVSVTNGSTAITFSGAQTMGAGDLLVFSSQPGVYYAISAAIVAATAGTLTTAFQGTTNAAATSTRLATLAGTFAVTNGSASVTTSSSQVGVVAVGDSLTFASQIGTYYTVAALTTSTITLSNPYTGTTNAATHASDVCTAGTAATALQTAMALLTGIGAPSVTGAVITLSRTDGFLTDIQGWLANGFASIQLADTTADPGIAADLAAISAANGGSWYGLVLDSNSPAEIKAAAAYIEATGKGGKIFFGNTSDYQNGQSTITTDVFSVLHGLAYTKSFVQNNYQQLLCYAGASACAYALSQIPGSYTLAFKSEPGVPVDSETTLPEGQGLAINSMTSTNPGPGAKFGNYYKSFGGQSYLMPGCAPSGQFFDLTILIDWLVVNLQAAGIAYLGSLPKVPMDAIGLGGLGDAYMNVLNQGAQNGGLLPTGADATRPLVVGVPAVSSLTPTQRASRIVGGYTFSAGLAGAIQGAVITGTINP